MYVMNFCTTPGCKNTALSSFASDGTLIEKSLFCYDHTEDKKAVTDKIIEYINSHEKIVGLDACGISFADIDLSEKKFYGCNFHHCTFTGIHASKLRSRMCIFDFSVFFECSFLESNMQYTSFAGASLSQVLLTGSDLIDNNFNGIAAYQSSFDDSDLYNSRFIRATLDNTSFRNCNIKKTIFFESKRENVAFKLSNTREALFDRNNTGLISELDQLTEEDMSK